MSMDLVFTRRFSMGHRLYHTGGKCAQPHGHNEYVKVTLKPNGVWDPKKNMSIDFYSAKKKWHQWIDDHVDHAFQVASDDPILEFFATHEPSVYEKCLVTEGDPTTEALALCMAMKLKAFLNEDDNNLSLLKLEIEETPTNTVVLDLTTRSVLAEVYFASGSYNWWNRPDMSINNFNFSQPQR